MSKQEILPGIHTVSTILRLQPERVQSVWVEQDKHNQRVDSIISMAKKFGAPVQIVQRNTLDQLCEGTQHQGVLAKCTATPLLNENQLIAQCEQANTPPLLLALDEISDPHNLGACLRTADAAGVDAVIFPQRNSAPISATVHKIASGASIRLPLVKTVNLARCLAALKKAGLWVYGADGEAKQSIYSANLAHPTIIVLGAEGRGLRALTKKNCDQLCSLPMLGAVESLNVSVATGVLLYEALRQRNV